MYKIIQHNDFLSVIEMRKKIFEIVVASGKGGTGKTTLSGFLVSRLSLDRVPLIAVDADVEAPDLVLVLGKERKIIRKEEIFESDVSEINYERCSLCMKCYEACAFNAIEVIDNKPVIVEQLCEGCGVCAIICPDKAIRMKRVKTGDLLVYETKFSKVVTGSLELGRKHSGMLVEILKRRAREILNEDGIDSGIIVVDAAAGIGCPVISSIAGSDYLVVVIEPTDQSLFSAKRMIEIGKTFGLPIGVVINKWDINPNFYDRIVGFAESEGITLLGRIPFTKKIAEAYSQEIPIINLGDNQILNSFEEVYSNLLKEIKGRGAEL